MRRLLIMRQFWELPLGQTGLLPVVEVLAVDWLGLELGLKDGLNLREGVEPSKDCWVALSGVEAAVEFVADWMRETGYFTGNVHRVSGGIMSGSLRQG
jgi:hypothetical protein